MHHLPHRRLAVPRTLPRLRLLLGIAIAVGTWATILFLLPLLYVVVGILLGLALAHLVSCHMRWLLCQHPSRTLVHLLHHVLHLWGCIHGILLTLHRIHLLRIPLLRRHSIHWIRCSLWHLFWNSSYCLLLLLGLPPGLIGLLPLGFFLIVMNAFLNICIQLSALSCWKLVQLEFEDFSSTLLNAISHNIYNSPLLFAGKQPNIWLKLSFFMWVHCSIIVRHLQYRLNYLGYRLLSSRISRF